MKRLFAALLVLALFVCAVPAMAEEAAPAAPKYVFMFIGDGMGNPQVTATQYYLGALENPDSELPVPAALSFTGFENVGLMTTYDASSFCPDSASTATSMASGNKTLSGVLNYNVDLTESFKLITEYAKEAGKKVGVISSVSLDHATPAAYYAKSESRNEYYNIALQGVTGTTLDFLGGGTFLQPDGEDGAQDNLFTLAEENGFTVVDTAEEYAALSSESGRTLAINPTIAEDSAMLYEIDRIRRTAEGEESMSLADMVKAGITVLDNDEEGFFLMTEGGKIDWSCHANDAKTSIMDTIALSDAVQVAIDFAAEHPDETLIIVTADHETGGMTIGFTTTNYDTYLTNLTKQTMSFVKFDSIIDTLRAQGASFEAAMAEAKKAFGLITANDADAANPEYENLILTDYELEGLRTAYERSMTVGAAGQGDMTQRDYELYGTYQPFSVELCHVLNHKSGMDHTTWSHTGAPVNLYAIGAGSDKFTGAFDNTEIFHKLAELTNVQ